MTPSYSTEPTPERCECGLKCVVIVATGYRMLTCESTSLAAIEAKLAELTAPVTEPPEVVARRAEVVARLAAYKAAAEIAETVRRWRKERHDQERKRLAVYARLRKESEQREALDEAADVAAASTARLRDSIPQRVDATPSRTARPSRRYLEREFERLLSTR